MRLFNCSTNKIKPTKHNNSTNHNIKDNKK